ncbi:MAG: phosphoenolpyruvate carboxykinase (ATP) [Flavobacteriaceae bacterium]|nr:phosphoenolpyruvate carboxykinase (ATP) [Flavobacteriaceae bacterium]
MNIIASNPHQSKLLADVMAAAAKLNVNLSAAELVQKALERNEGVLADSGALCADTGEFTGRSPKDKFSVYDSTTENVLWWGDVNFKFTPEKFDALLDKMLEYVKGKELFVRDCYACADPTYRLNVKVITETAFNNLFAHNLFLRPEAAELPTLSSDWLILNVPSFKANADEDGTREHNFSIINFTKKIYIIGGSGYTGEIKKGIFTVLNYSMPHEHNVLSMHCSANIGKDGDTAIFFGLSGTGKTTLSADPNRALIGDDEHGWSENSVFNFEGGCYAKCVDLTKEKEPEIFNAIKEGALLENTRFIAGTNTPDYTNITITENTRAAYPMYNLKNFATPSIGKAPKNIFFLTADAFGVLPPISRLDVRQAMYSFISGYTAKVAGTEAGVIEPQATFSACFGKAFLPLHPGKYAKLLGEKLNANPDIKVWLINTGWTGGPYGVGNRMKLSFTRRMITAALNGELDGVAFEKHPVFGYNMPTSCPEVPVEILNPRNTWADKDAYDQKANHLAELFNKNMKQYEDGLSADVLAAAPVVNALA